MFMLVSCNKLDSFLLKIVLFLFFTALGLRRCEGFL